jgi:hypothetical protein
VVRHRSLDPTMIYTASTRTSCATGSAGSPFAMSGQSVRSSLGRQRRTGRPVHNGRAQCPYGHDRGGDGMSAQDV